MLSDNRNLANPPPPPSLTLPCIAPLWRTVEFEYHGDPIDAKHCHCTQCQRLHGAPFQWAALFHKTSVRLAKHCDPIHLDFFSTQEGHSEHSVPCKISCRNCRSPMADEGRNMVMAYPSPFVFENNEVPSAFAPTAHIFYSERVMDLDDDVPKVSIQTPQPPLPASADLERWLTMTGQSICNPTRTNTVGGTQECIRTASTHAQARHRPDDGQRQESQVAVALRLQTKRTCMWSVVANVDKVAYALCGCRVEAVCQSSLALPTASVRFLCCCSCLCCVGCRVLAVTPCKAP